MKQYIITAVVAISSLATYAQQAPSTLDGMTAEQRQAYLEVPANQAAYVAELNQRIRQNASDDPYNAVITGVTIGSNATPVDTAATQISGGQVSGAKEYAAVFNNLLGTTYWEKYRFTYESVDGANNLVTLSGAFYVESPSKFSPFVDFIKTGLLVCHPTQTDNQKVPSQPLHGDWQIAMEATENCIVVCPDYCGYGVSVGKQHPYLIQDVTSRNCVDGYLAAVSLARNMGLPFDGESYWLTDVMGFSQGGSVALACVKYIENKLDPAIEKEKIKLRYAYCGDGPYSPHATVNQYIEWANSDDEEMRKMEYPSVLPLIVMAAKDAYDKGCMRTVKVEDYFTPEFLAGGIVDAITRKDFSTSDLDKYCINGFNMPEKIFSDKIIKRNSEGKLVFNEETNEYKCLMRALDKNDLTKGWTPHHKIVFFHWANDRTVPDVNYEEAYKSWHDKVFYDEDNKKQNVFWYYTAEDAMKDITFPWNYGYSWDTNKSHHSDTGELFYRWFMDNDFDKFKNHD